MENKKIKDIKENKTEHDHSVHSEHKHEENKMKNTKEDHQGHDHSAHAGHDHKHEENKAETKMEDKKQIVKETKPKIKKDFAIVNGPSVHISKRHGIYICAFIKGKKIDQAISDLQKVIMLKKAVPFKGEIPHRKGNIMSGRYPVNASKAFISVLKGLKGNIAVNGLSPDKARIVAASASWASRPHTRDGARFKRTHIVLKARETGEKK